MDTPRTAAAKRCIVAVNSIEHASLVISSLRASSMARRHSMSDIPARTSRPSTAPGEIADVPAVNASQVACEEDNEIYNSINLFDSVVASTAMDCILQKEKELSVMAALNDMSTMSINQNEEDDSDVDVDDDNEVVARKGQTGATSADAVLSSTGNTISSNFASVDRVSSKYPSLDSTASVQSMNSSMSTANVTSNFSYHYDQGDDDQSIDSFNMSSDEDDGPGLKASGRLQHCSNNVDITAFDFGEGNEDDDGYHVKKGGVLRDRRTSDNRNIDNNKRGIPLVTGGKSVSTTSKDKKVGAAAGGKGIAAHNRPSSSEDVDEGFVLDPAWLQRQEEEDLEDRDFSESHSSKAKAQIPPAYMSVKEENARKLARKKQADDENKELFSGFVAPRQGKPSSAGDADTRGSNNSTGTNNAYASITSKSAKGKSSLTSGKAAGSAGGSATLLSSTSGKNFTPLAAHNRDKQGSAANGTGGAASAGSSRVIVKPGQRIRVLPGANKSKKI